MIEDFHRGNSARQGFCLLGQGCSDGQFSGIFNMVNLLPDQLQQEIYNYLQQGRFTEAKLIYDAYSKQYDLKMYTTEFSGEFNNLINVAE